MHGKKYQIKIQVTKKMTAWYTGIVQSPSKWWWVEWVHGLGLEQVTKDELYGKCEVLIDGFS